MNEIDILYLDSQPRRDFEAIGDKSASSEMRI